MLVTERVLVLVSCALALSGLFVLFLGVRALEENPLSYTEFLEEDESVRVVMDGTVKRISHTESSTIISFETGCTLPLIVFEHINVSGDIRVIGTKKYYEGKPEILVERVMER